MLLALVNIFKIPELKKRILITASLLVVYRLGCFVSTPGIDGAALSKFWIMVGGKIKELFIKLGKKISR